MKHPKGLYLLFFTEMWERFSYYGMRAIFVLFLTKALLMSGADASNIYGSFTGLVYLTPLVGGYISDRYWGNRRSIIWGGILMAIGQFMMFASGSMLGSASATSVMVVALTLLIIGNGFFKPNISTMVGQLYPQGDRRVDAAFTIFYMGINAGAFLSPLVCGGVGDTGHPEDFRWGFLAAGVGMIISVIAFVLYKDKYIVDAEGNPVGMPPAFYPERKEAAAAESSNSKGNTSYLITALIGVALVAVFHYFFDIDWIGSFIYGASISVPLMIITDSSLTGTERDRIMVIFILAFFVIFFWSAFEQAGASLTLFADKNTNRFVGGWEMPASWFQSINPLGIIVLAPLFSWLWGVLHERKLEPPSPLKMAIGLLLVCVGYMVIAYGVKGVSGDIKISMWFLVVLYVLHTMGELCLSPIGLAMVSKLAPLRFSSLLMGTWFLANATANKLAGSLSALIPPGQGEAAADAKMPSILGYQITNLYDFFMIFIIYSGLAAAILFLIYRILSKLMHGIK